MPKASEIASELRKLAEILDRSPETDLPRPSILLFSQGKGSFLSALPFVPRPFTKEYEDDPRYPSINRLIVKHSTPALEVELTVHRSAMCKLIKPAQAAVYECEPLLTDAEIDEVSAA